MKFLTKYDNFLLESSNLDVFFYDKNGTWFSKGKLSDISDHKKDKVKFIKDNLRNQSETTGFFVLIKLPEW